MIARNSSLLWAENGSYEDMTVWMLHMEPIEERYSKQWVQYFDYVFQSNNIAYENIWGDHVSSNLSGKFFLDPVSTNIWKLTQLSNLLKNYDKIRNGDIVFFTDLWNPGLEVLPYVKALLGKNIRLMGYLHAGSYDYWDLTNQAGMTSWAKGLEESWLSCCEKVFVATDFHKRLLTQSRIVDKSTVKVVGFPLDINRMSRDWGNYYKKNYLVFTGRKSVEKGYQKVLKLRTNNDIVITLDNKLSKQDYYKVLKDAFAVIAPSEQETFGIGIVEGMACGCIPIVPDKLAFQETVPTQFRYRDDSDMQQMIDDARYASVQDRQTVMNHAQRYQYQDVIRHIINHF